VDVGRHLAAAGAPATVPADLLPPGAHREDGLVLTFWRHVDHDPARPLDAAAIGRTLRRIHDALADYPGTLPPLADAMAETRRMLDELGPAETPLIERALHRAERAMAGDAERPVHGDSTRGNLLLTPDGPIWNDFEEACVASPWWDLACLATTPRRLGLDEGLTDAELDLAFAAYGARRDEPALAPYLVARTAQTTAWAVLMAAHDPAERPYRDLSLAWWSERAPTGW
jgi:Ser/Thr protein kinase RdoA (MazF antagonist)